MARLFVHVEGETEERFVNQVLRDYLVARGFERVDARLLGNARQRDRRGGIRGWNTVRREIIRHLSEDIGCIATTMVDYYGLPQAGEKAWPGRADATSLPVPSRGPRVQAALLEDLARDIERHRFIPFVVEKLVPEYQKPLFGNRAAVEIGLDTIRAECPHLASWLDRLEALA